MINIHYSKKFKNNYKKRVAKNSELKKKMKAVIETFTSGGSLIHLHDHKLRGSMHSLRSFAINSEYRIVYKVTKDMIIFLDIS